MIMKLINIPQHMKLNKLIIHIFLKIMIKNIVMVVLVSARKVGKSELNLL